MAAPASEVVLIEALAVALRWQRQGVADEALEVVGNWALERADVAGHTTVLIMGHIHPDNAPSQAMAKRHHASVTQQDDGYLRFQIVLPVPER